MSICFTYIYTVDDCRSGVIEIDWLDVSGLPFLSGAAGVWILDAMKQIFEYQNYSLSIFNLLILPLGNHGLIITLFL